MITIRAWNHRRRMRRILHHEGFRLVAWVPSWSWQEQWKGTFDGLLILVTLTCLDADDPAVVEAEIYATWEAEIHLPDRGVVVLTYDLNSFAAEVRRSKGSLHRRASSQSGKRGHARLRSDGGWSEKAPGVGARSPAPTSSSEEAS